ncbi:hypothetical protein L2A60_18925, partial [Acidiphilium iwatense]|nr:hypothetical protein [Acidiphilium iwatense]
MGGGDVDCRQDRLFDPQPDGVGKVWAAFQDEQASLMALRGPFDGFVEKVIRASTTCLIMADHNR